jgi:hypothetical protein
MGSGFRVWTAGEVVSASNVNNYLQEQAVMSFAGTAARSSAVASPEEGMLSYLQDTDTYQGYDGAAWVNLGTLSGASNSGLIHIKTVTDTGVSSISLGSDADPVFTSTYENYRILINSAASSVVDRKFNLRIRQNVTDITANNYQSINQGLSTADAAINDLSGASTSSVILSNGHYSESQNNYVISLDIYSPFLSKYTTWIGLNIGLSSTHWHSQRVGGFYGGNDSANGFTILNSSGNFTNATVSVFGYRI